MVKWPDNICYPGPQLRELLKWPRSLPLEEERVRLLHEVILAFTTLQFATENFSLYFFFNPLYNLTRITQLKCVIFYWLLSILKLGYTIIHFFMGLGWAWTGEKLWWKSIQSCRVLWEISCQACCTCYATLPWSVHLLGVLYVVTFFR